MNPFFYHDKDPIYFIPAFIAVLLAAVVMICWHDQAWAWAVTGLLFIAGFFFMLRARREDKWRKQPRRSKSVGRDPGKKAN